MSAGLLTGVIVAGLVIYLFLAILVGRFFQFGSDSDPRFDRAFQRRGDSQAKGSVSEGVKAQSHVGGAIDAAQQ